MVHPKLGTCFCAAKSRALQRFHDAARSGMLKREPRCSRVGDDSERAFCHASQANYAQSSKETSVPLSILHSARAKPPFGRRNFHDRARVYMLALGNSWREYCFAPETGYPRFFHAVTTAAFSDSAVIMKLGRERSSKIEKRTTKGAPNRSEFSWKCFFLCFFFSRDRFAKRRYVKRHVELRTTSSDGLCLSWFRPL